MKVHAVMSASLSAALGSVLLTSAAHAATIADVKLATATTGNNPTIDSAVVTYIIPPATAGGAITTFLVQDATGADEIYLGTANATGYTPTVGDTITATGNSYSFHGLYELESYTAGSIALSVTKTGSGAALPTPSVFTTAGLTNGSAVGVTQQSTLGTLSAVTFSATGTFAAAGTYTVTDALGGTATVYVPKGNVLVGAAIPTGSADIYGYLGQYDATATQAPSTNGYELVPLSTSASATPEPASLAMLGVAGMLGLRRRRA